MADPLETTCCALDCYASQSCKLAFSDECYKATTECAMGEFEIESCDSSLQLTSHNSLFLGDTFQFALHPIFEHLESNFQCHIRQRKPKILYQLWFYISVLGTKFETPRIYRTIHLDDVESLSQGEYELEFLTIQHDTGLQLQDEFILHGQKSQNKWNYTMNILKKPQDYDNSKIEVRALESQKTYDAVIQFDRPFGYSASSWSEGNNCKKNLTRIKRKQSHFVEGMGQDVRVITESVRDPYRYYIQGQIEAPHINLITPGKGSFLIMIQLIIRKCINMSISSPANVSILSWWFRDKDLNIIADETLLATLNLSSDHRVWEITISGRFTPVLFSLQFLQGEMLSCSSYVRMPWLPGSDYQRP